MALTREQFLTAVGYSGLALWSVAPAVCAAGGATLPVPCVPSSCGASGPTAWLTSGAATATETGNQLTIKQGSNDVTLNWSSFNVSGDGKVVFQQPGATSIALNRIFQASPSTIYGTIQANGQIYLVNPNGMIFAPTASVNAAGILASTLGISDTAFQEGIVSPALIQNQQPALASDGRTEVLDQNGNPVLGANGQPIPVQLSVQNGAQLSTSGSGGRILLASQNVSNAGTLTANGGQVILAAGSSVFLFASTDPALRGLLVEVDQGGTAWNQVQGQISAPTGNITLAGLAVNQDGRVSATTTVSANGSITLQAQDTALFSGNGPPSAQNAGTVTLGPGSVTEVLPALNDASTAVADQTQLQSNITISGEQVYFQSGSSVVAPSAQLTVTAQADPSQSNPAPDPNARIRIDPGAVIDLEGSVATLPMSANLLNVQLNAVELADDPLQRNGPLHGQTVTIDTRVGTPLANVSADIAAIPENIAQRTETGGSATFESAGDIVAANGATINVSGGYTNYQGGTIATTELVQANGTIVNIGNASPNEVYTGVINSTYTVLSNTWGTITNIPGINTGHYQPGYQQGAAAGSLDFAAPAMVLNANLLGNAVLGPYQRTPATEPGGGQLILGLPNPLPSATTGFTDDYRLPSVTFVAGTPEIAVSDNAPLPQGLTLQLPTAYLGNGFTSTQVYSNGSIEVAPGAPLNMLPGSTLALHGNDIEINSNISSAGGTLLFDAIQTNGVNGVPGPAPGIRIGDDVTLDVRGNWTNDQLLPWELQPTSEVNVNGGSITAELSVSALSGLGTPQLIVGSGAQFELSGGAWLQRNGQLQYGSGGALSLTSDGTGNQFLIGGQVGLDAYGAGTAAGGSLLLEADQIGIAPLAPTAGWESGITQPGAPLTISPSLFSDYGLVAVTLVANGAPSTGATNILSVHPDAAIDAIASSWLLASGYQNQLSAPDVMALGSPQLLPEAERSPMSVTLSAAPSTYTGTLQAAGLSLPAGASLSGDPGATFTLTGRGAIDIGGTIDAPGGTVDVAITTPGASEDPGFLPDLALTLESTAVIDVAGTTVLQPGNAVVQLGTVLDGGSVSLIAKRGSVDVLAGAVVDVAGSEGLLDLPGPQNRGYVSTEVASAGGAVVVQSPDAISWLGSLEAAAGHGSGAPVSAGSLTIDLDPSTNGAGGYPTGVRTVEVLPGAGPSQLAGSTATTALLGTQFLSASGIDQLVLESPAGVIEFDPGTNLNLGRELDLVTPLIQVTGAAGSARVAAPYVLISNPFANGDTAQPGTGTLQVSGHFIDLVGDVVFSGLGDLTLASSTDVRLTSVNLAGTIAGELTTAGDLTVDSERLYPSTGSSFVLAASGANSTLTIGQSGTSPGDPLSVNGAVTLSAPIIQDSGTVLAPFGSIIMNASQSLTLAPGSLTSVSGDKNLYLYGEVIDGQWFSEGGGAALAVTQAPGRNVQLQAPLVSIAKGATIDVAGGGDLYTYEWTPGTGGTLDQLAASVNPNLFAILPSLTGQLAPFDPALTGAETPSAGMSVYLSGVPGLPAGAYPLLPARYALLPGAFLVSAIPGSNGTAAGVITMQPDGATAVAGYYLVPGTQLASPETVGFAVQPGSYAFQLADYTTYTGTNFLTTVASSPPTSVTALPASAGTLILDVSEALNAAGSVLASAAPGGQGALIEVEAPSLEVTGSGAAASGSVHISSGVLQSWDPARLVLGGVVSANAPVNGTPPATPSTLTVAANTVTVDSGATLDLDDITLLAASNIVVQSGAELSTPTPTAALSPTPTAVSVSGASQAAMLELSSISYETPVRGAPGTASPGTITLAPGATVRSGGSAVIDAPGGGTLGGALSGSGTIWSLGANQIDFAGTEQPGTLTVTPGLQTVLEAGSALRLAAGTIVLDTPVDLAPVSGGLKSVTLDTGELSNAATGDSSISAASIIFGNPFAVAAASTVANAGTLEFSGHEVSVGNGTVAFAGFSAVDVAASGDFTFTGSGGLDASGDLTIGAGRVLAASDAGGMLQSAGTLNVTNSGSAPATSAAPVGGALTLQANTVNVSGTLLLPSGNVTINAADALNIQSGALLSVAGESVTAAGRTLGSGGGTLDLNSGGTFSAAQGATLSVSAAGDSNAGTIAIVATGAAQTGATFDGAGGNGGSFQLIAASLDNFAALNNQLQSGGFDWQRSMDVGSGDLVLPGGERLTAHLVNLVAESGMVQVGGTITAPSGASASSIGLYGATGVTLLSGGSLIADATGGAGRGGELTIGTSTGTIDLQPGSVISALGSSQPGTLLLRAPATGSDVAIAEIASNTAGLATVVVEPVEAFGISATPSAADFTNIFTQVSTYASAAIPEITARLQPASSATTLIVEPGIELDTPGDVTLGSLDLSTWRFGTSPAVLTVRAGGSVTVDGTISDGFTNSFSENGPIVAPLPGLSATIQIVAGARGGSPDPLATVTGTPADLTLASGSIVRSGTGEVDLIASQDLVFQAGASVYTGGQIAAAPITVDPTGTANFLTGGGNLLLSAGRDVVGSFVVSSPADWQIRGFGDQNTSGGGDFWGPDPTLFPWNAGTLGGGQVEVTAGRDILNLSAAAADSGAVNGGTLTTYGGGSLTVSAGRDVDTGYFYVSEAPGLIEAGDALGSATQNSGGTPLGTTLIAGSSPITVEARGNVLLESVMNQTEIGQPNSAEPGGFFTYGDSSSLQVESSGGTVQITAGDAEEFIGAADYGVTNTQVPSIFPSTLQVRAFGGNIDLQSAFIYLYPSPSGQLDLFAAGNITGGQIVQSDATPGSVPTPLNAAAGSGVSSGLFTSAQSALHTGDLVDAEVTAGLDLQDSLFSIAKPVLVSVGDDMTDTSLIAQNLRPGDVTQVTVGGNLIYDSQSVNGQITLGGPGSLYVAVGGQLNLGFSNGISTTGRLLDPQIQSTTGANVTVLAGLGAQGEDIGNFLSKIVAPSATYSQELIALVTPAGASAPSYGEALSLFDELNTAAQTEFVDTVFFNALVTAGRLANSSPGSDFVGGYAAIDALFPGSRSSASTYAGDLTLDFSRIYTLQGGDISLLAPGGGVDVGLAVPPVGVDVQRSPSQLGIVAEEAGNVSIYAADNVLVNASRIFTLGGGNIAIWSTTGNIDAGRGAKASVSAPPPLVVVDASGNITLDFSGAVAGSGIRTITTQAGEAFGDVDLMAPVGFVNAGDAGIGSAGNLNIAARAVLGTQNISVGGVATGVPPEVSGIGASLSGAAAAGASASNASSAATAEQGATSAAPASASALSWLEVFVLGLGEENCDPKDMECIKRQKTSESH